MALHRSAAHQRRAQRSGDDIYWEAESSPQVSHPSPRPQSALEGRQLDTWLEHLHSKVRPSSCNSSVTGLDKEPTWRRSSYPSFSAGLSSCGSSSVCESSPSSQDSPQAGILSPSERRGSWEKAHIMWSPKKEQTQLGYLAPVKIGWLPIRRRVMVANACSHKGLDNSAGQVRNKPSYCLFFLHVFSEFWKTCFKVTTFESKASQSLMHLATSGCVILIPTFCL